MSLNSGNRFAINAGEDGENRTDLFCNHLVADDFPKR